MVRITLGKRLRQPWLFARSPLEFKSIQNPVNFLQVIDFLLLLCPPKVAFPIKKAVRVVLHAFAHEIILP